MNLIREEVSHGRQARTDQVTIGPADLVHARSRAFKSRVENSLLLMQDAQKLGKLGLGFSSGKDSTVLLGLAREALIPHQSVFFDSGCEYKWTYQLVEHYGVTTVHPKMSLPEMCRHGGYWGYATPTDPEATFNFGEVLITEPSMRFIKEHGIGVLGLGLRVQESYGRARMLTSSKLGALFKCKYDDTWHLNPIAHWKTDDVWAYIASRKLAYNRAYDIMTGMGVPRDEQRVSTLLGTTYATHGRYSMLRQIDPETYQRLVHEFPKIGGFT